MSSERAAAAAASATLDRRLPPACLAGLYEAALDESQWPPWIKGLANSFTAERIEAVCVDVECGQQRMAVRHGFERTGLLVAPGGLCMGQERPNDEVAGRLIERHIFSAWSDVDSDHRLCLVEEADPGFVVGLAMYRARNDRAFSKADRDEFARLGMHLRNVGRIMRRIAAASAASAAIGAAIDRLSIAIAVVDRQSRVGLLNRATRALARTGALSLDEGRIAVGRGDDSRRLQAMIAEALEAASADRLLPREIKVNRLRAAPLTVRVVPVMQQVAREAAGPGDGPLAFVYIFDPEIRYETMPQMLQQIYGFTAAEAELVSAMLDGMKLGTIAESRGTSIGTARTQLKAAFRKTGAVDQAGLIRIVSGNPIIRIHADAFARVP